METISKQLDIIRRGAVEIIQLDELKKKLEKGEPLTIKAGFDPTVPDIHLGHTVLLRKLRHFQDLGHKVVFLIGDATALVGDPSGQSKTRKTLTRDEVEENAKTYVKQVSKILDTKDKKVFELRRNSEWFSEKAFGFNEFVELAKRYTVARLIERDDFQKRLKEQKPISFLELFYPLMQGYDSKVLKSDVEIGGTDQKFNMLVGRNLQQTYGQEPQVVMTMPLLEGTDGVDKMSKSLGNYIGIEEEPKEIFGKIMSISDDMMTRYYELLTDKALDKLKEDLKSNRVHPKDTKKKLAKIIIAQYYNEKEADNAEDNFEKAFKHNEFPDNIALLKVEADSMLGALSRIAQTSNSEVRRKINEGAVEINSERIEDINFTFQKGKEYKIRIGRKFFRIIVNG